MFISQWHKSDDLCERCAHMYKQTLTLNEWINEVEECEWNWEFWGKPLLWVEMKCLVATSLLQRDF